MISISLSGIEKSAKNDLSSVTHAVSSAASSAEHTTENVVSTATGEVKHVASDLDNVTLNEVEQEGLDAITPAPPKYEKLTPQEQSQVNAAKKADQGQSVVEQSIVDSSGKHHEPINIEFTGSQKQLQGALESQGWEKGYQDGQKPVITDGNLANLVPFSVQKAKNFKGQEVAPSFVMAKDSTGLNRHHLRAYLLGTNSDEQQVWGIASSRDNHPTIHNGQINHYSDPHVDDERNTVLNDLFQARDEEGGNLELNVVQGEPDEGKAKKVAGTDQYDVNKGEYYSDDEVYQVKFT